MRSYLRHGATQAFGIITSPTSNCHYDSKLAYVPGWEDVLVWDLKRGEMVSMWHSTGHTAPVTQICASPNPVAEGSEGAGDGKVVGVGYQDGSIRVWNWSGVTGEEAAEVVTFNGHKKAVVAMAYDAEGTRLASGGLEGEIIIWDTVGEVGLFRCVGRSQSPNLLTIQTPLPSRADNHTQLHSPPYRTLNHPPGLPALHFQRHFPQAMGSLHSALHPNHRRLSRRGSQLRRSFV